MPTKHGQVQLHSTAAGMCMKVQKHPCPPASIRDDVEQVSSLLSMLDQLRSQHQDAASKTHALHDACERLVAEKDRLIEFSANMRGKLAYFDELEVISSQFHSASLAVESDKFVPILRRLDECIM